MAASGIVLIQGLEKVDSKYYSFTVNSISAGLDIRIERVCETKRVQTFKYFITR